MKQSNRTRYKRGWQPLRRVSLLLVRFGITSEIVAIVGMILGIIAGAAFMGTAQSSLSPMWFWGLAMICCLLRLACIEIDDMVHHHFSQHSVEEVFFNELPERVADAITLIGFGFSINGSPWLGLACALAAIFSAYVRSLGVIRGAGSKSAASGPMTRVHRLILLSITCLLMLLDLPTEQFSTPIPQIGLWIILVGCIATIIIRWLNIKGFEKV